jgi:hypothetical protein
MRVLPRSPRRRRRLAWGGAVLLGVLLFAVLAVAVPKTHDSAPTATLPDSGAVILPSTEREVPVRAAERKRINATLDAFVRAGVARHDVRGAWDLVTPSMRAGISRTRWNSGALPVMPYTPTGSLHGYRVIFSHARDLSVDLVLHPAKKEKLGAVIFRVGLRKQGSRWLVDSMAPTAIFAPSDKRAAITAAADFAPNPTPPPTKARLSGVWLVVPVALLGLPLAILVGALLLSSWRRRGSRGSAEERARAAEEWQRMRQAALAARGEEPAPERVE